MSNWPCPSCGTVNSEARFSCIVCSFERVQLATRSAPSAPYPRADSGQGVMKAGPPRAPSPNAPAPLTPESTRAVGKRTVAAVIVMLLAAAAIALIATRTGSSTDGDATGPPVTPLTSSPSPSQAPSEPTNSTGVTVAETAPTVTQPSDPSFVTLSPGVVGIDVPGVQESLDRYFTAINRHDWAAARGQFTAAERSKVSQAKMAQGDASTQDSNVILEAVAVGTAGDTAIVSFRSIQPPSDSPDGSPCNQWRLRYKMVQGGNGWLIDSVSSAGGSGYSSC